MTRKVKIALLVSAALAATLAGLFCFTAPHLERTKMKAEQEKLLISIAAGDGQLMLHPDLGLNFYDTTGMDVIVLDPQGETIEPTETAEISEPQVAGGIGVLTIDKIDATLPVTDGVSRAQLKIAEGWVPQTAPIGETGNAVIAGHRSYTYGEHFNRLGELAEGDTIRYTTKDGEEMTFTVTELLTVLPGDTAAFTQPEDTAMLTLYTCTPIRTATHRLLVRAERNSISTSDGNAVE